MSRNLETIILLVFFCGIAFAEEAKTLSSPPRYELKLNLAEFSVLNSAAKFGIGKYGGTADFGIRLAKDGNDMVWTVTITNPRLMEVWELWMAEKTTELVNLLDFNNLDTTSKTALDTAKSVNAKITQARANPIWEPVKSRGRLIEENGQWFINGEHGRLELKGDKLRGIEKLKDKSVIATGFVKTAGQMELTNIIEKKQNTLELFVMSNCPFAKKAETSIIEFLDKYNGESRPNLEIHYIFQKKNQDGKDSFTSMHSEKEVQENLVQIAIREMQPEVYHKYLLARADNNSPWTELADRLELTEDDINQITELSEKNRDDLIQTEYDYATTTYQVYDGSPAYIWESERIKNIKEAEPFKGLDFSNETCAAEK